MGSVSGDIHKFRTGDVDAAARIWERYASRLTRLATTRLPNSLNSYLSGEDLASDALAVVLMGFKDGKWPGVQNRDHLWALLAKITYHRAFYEIKKAKAKKRPPLNAMVPLDDLNVPAEKPADIEVEAKEQFEKLIAQLGSHSSTLGAIALMLCDDFNQKDIAAKLGCSTKSVGRKIEIIKLKLEEILLRSIAEDPE